MKYKTLIWIIVAVVAAAAVLWFFRRKDSSSDYENASPKVSGNGSGTQGGSNGATGTGNDGGGGGSRTIEIDEPTIPTVLGEETTSEVSSFSNVRKVMGRS